MRKVAGETEGAGIVMVLCKGCADILKYRGKGGLLVFWNAREKLGGMEAWMTCFEKPSESLVLPVLPTISNLETRT